MGTCRSHHIMIVTLNGRDVPHPSWDFEQVEAAGCFRGCTLHKSKCGVLCSIPSKGNNCDLPFCRSEYESPPLLHASAGSSSWGLAPWPTPTTNIRNTISQASKRSRSSKTYTFFTFTASLCVIHWLFLIFIWLTFKFIFIFCINLSVISSSVTSTTSFLGYLSKVPGIFFTSASFL